MDASDHRVFFESVQAYFLDRTGRGLMLSSRDIELVMAWRSDGATVALVCRAIDEATERLAKTPRDLYALRRFVDERLRESAPAAPLFVEAPRPTSEPTAPWDDAHAMVSSALTTSDRPEVVGALQLVAQRIDAAKTQDLEPWSTLAELDDLLVNELFSRLSEDERRLIDLEIEANHGAMLSMLDAPARAAAMLEGRRATLTTRYGLPTLLG